MAFKVGQDQDEYAPMAEINVTPFVDVALVLLVIFMVTAPMLVREQLNVNLPKTKTGEKSASKALEIVIDKEGKVTISGQPISMESLEDRVKKELEVDSNVQAVISADTDSKHGDVVTVIDHIKRAGLTRFAIQIDRQ